MPYLFTSESVSEGHPDKISDQISDALVDHFLAYDNQSRVACETLVTTGQVIVAGEVRSRAYLDVQTIARDMIRKIGYTNSNDMFEANSCGILSAIHEQSPDISRGLDQKNKKNQGAGDQGIMFGYATNETDNYMPLPIELAHMLVKELADIRKKGKVMNYLKPDAKSQVTIEYDDHDKPIRIDTIVISSQHSDFGSVKTMLETIKKDILSIIIPRIKKKLPKRIQRLFSDATRYQINPTGKFVVGGPHSDTGITGRKIIVDTYGGQGAHGGGAFSGKDPSKVDRSSSYATRHIAKNMVAAKLCDRVLIQVAYAIGIAKPISLYVNTYNTSHVKMDDGAIAKKIEKIFDMTPYAIEQRFNLRSPIYTETAAYGHMGRTPQVVEKTFTLGNGKEKKKITVELFPWEKLDYRDTLIKSFSLAS